MNDDGVIQFGEGRLGVNMTKATLNEHLRPHGLCVAPLPAPEPPPQTEAERLVEIAKGLPEEVWKGSGWRDPLLKVSGMVGLFGNDDWQHFLADQFRTILLGVMSAYLGTEVAFWVGYLTNMRGKFHDTIEMYATCCQSLAERRKGDKQ